MQARSNAPILSGTDALAMNVTDAKKIGLAPPEAETIEERIAKTTAR